MPDDTQTARREKLVKLAEEFYLDRQRSYSGAEDFEEYMDGTAAIHPWVSITVGGEDSDMIYVYADFDHANDAKARAGQFVQDSIYRETPEAVVNLDTGERLRPTLKVEWS